MRLVRIFFFKQLALIALLFNHRVRAISYWEHVRSLSPHDPNVPASIALLKAEIGLKSEAIDLLEESLDISPSQWQVWYNLGFLRQELALHSGAIDAFDRVICINEKADLAYYGKAISLIKIGQSKEAIPLLLRNTELQPLSPYGWYQLAHVYHSLGQQNKLKNIILKVSRFEPSVALRLQKETGFNAGVTSPFTDWRN